MPFLVKKENALGESEDKPDCMQPEAWSSGDDTITAVLLCRGSADSIAIISAHEHHRACLKSHIELHFSNLVDITLNK